MKKRKNPWIKRRAKEKFKAVLQKIEEHPVVNKKLVEHNGIIGEVKTATEEVGKLSNDYLVAAKNIKMDEGTIQDLSIASLKDLSEVEKTGRVKKTQFRDVLKAGELRKKALEAIENKEDLMAKSKVVYIDLLKTKIEALIDILGEEDGE
jgi:hypothetical protein